MTKHFHVVVHDFAEESGVEDSVLDTGLVCALERVRFDSWYDAAQEAIPTLLEKCYPFNHAQVWTTEDSPDARLLDLLDFEHHYMVELGVVESNDDGSCCVCNGYPPSLTLYDICQFGLLYNSDEEERNVPSRKEC
jgi:hypothetical protein